MTFFNNLYITLIVVILLTMATISGALAHPSTQPHHHEKSVFLGEYHFIMNQSDERVRFVLKNNQTLTGVCTQLSIPIDTCSRSILFENKRLFSKSTTWTRMENVDIRAAKKIHTRRHYVVPEEFSSIIRANITPKDSVAESTKFTLNPTIVNPVGLEHISTKKIAQEATPIIAIDTTQEVLPIENDISSLWTTVLISPKEKGVLEKKQQETSINPSAEKVSLQSTRIPTPPHQYESQEQNNEPLSQKRETPRSSFRVALVTILVFVVSGIILFITSEVVIPATKIHEESALLKKKNAQLEEELGILKEIFTQQKSYPLRPRYPEQEEETYQIIPIIKVSRNGEIEMAISPHRFMFMREFQHRLNGPTRTMKKNRETTPESIIVQLFQDTFPMNQPLNPILHAA